MRNKHQDLVKALETAVRSGNGTLRLKATWVARNFLPPGKRLGLPEDQYNVGERGWITERYLGSVTYIENDVGKEDEGLSYIDLGDGREVTLKEAVEKAPELFLGKAYAQKHNGLGRLIKIYDIDSRIPFHIHQRQEDAALVNQNSKDEAYYFLDGVPMGKHPETFFGVHPYIVEENLMEELILPHLIEWKDDRILQHSRAYLNVPEEGFFLPSGVLHAPGTALTLELQEDSDVFGMLQATVDDLSIPKELMYKDVRREDRETYGEKTILEQIDWETCGDPYFYENHHLTPRTIFSTDEYEEAWVYYNTTKFSGKRLRLSPGAEYRMRENGAYNILVWKGKGRFQEQPIEAGNFGSDELFITYNTAVNEHTVQNTGTGMLELFKFFGPDINPDCPMIEKRTKK